MAGSQRINLRFNIPMLRDYWKPVGCSIEIMLSSQDGLDLDDQLASPSALTPIRERVARSLVRSGWEPEPRSLIFAGSAKQALAAVFQTVARSSRRIALENLTYPVAKDLLTRLGLTPVPLALDQYGIVPDAITTAYREQKFDAIYLQPSVHSALGSTTPAWRRKEIVDVADELDVVLIEDAVYAFLEEPQPLPLAALAPQRTILIDSLSKRVSPGFSIGFISAPTGPLSDGIAEVIQDNFLAPQGWALRTAVTFLIDGTVAELEKARRRDALNRQRVARRALSGLDLIANPVAFQVWLNLPDNWTTKAFVSSAARIGIDIASGEDFAVDCTPRGVRLALASVSEVDLLKSLQDLAALVRAGPQCD